MDDKEICDLYEREILTYLNTYIRTHLFSKSNDNTYRGYFNECISQAEKQQMVLFSCSDGEFLQDTEKGGLCTSNFLEEAKNIARLKKKELLVSECHKLICQKVYKKV